MSAEVPLHVTERIARELAASGVFDGIDGRDGATTYEARRVTEAVIRELAVQGYEVRKAAA